MNLDQARANRVKIGRAPIVAIRIAAAAANSVAVKNADAAIVAVVGAIVAAVTAVIGRAANSNEESSAAIKVVAVMIADQPEVVPLNQ